MQLKSGKEKRNQKKNNNNKEKKNETVKYYGLEGGSSLNNEALRLRETGLLNHSVCSGHDTSFNRRGNYLTATVSNDRRLSYANVLPSSGSGNENNVISLSAVSYRNNEDFVKQQQFIK